MNKLLVYLLLILFSIQGFEQVLIRLNFKLNQDFYASICENKDKPELECNGCCHLKKQLKQSEEEKSSKEKQVNKREQQLYIQDINLNILNAGLHMKNKVYSSLNVFFTGLYYYDIFHPPRI